MVLDNFEVHMKLQGHQNSGKLNRYLCICRKYAYPEKEMNAAATSKDWILGMTFIA